MRMSLSLAHDWRGIRCHEGTCSACEREQRICEQHIARHTGPGNPEATCPIHRDDIDLPNAGTYR